MDECNRKGYPKAYWLVPNIVCIHYGGFNIPRDRKNRSEWTKAQLQRYPKAYWLVPNIVCIYYGGFNIPRDRKNRSEWMKATERYPKAYVGTPSGRMSSLWAILTSLYVFFGYFDCILYRCFCRSANDGSSVYAGVHTDCIINIFFYNIREFLKLVNGQVIKVLILTD